MENDNEQKKYSPNRTYRGDSFVIEYCVVCFGSKWSGIHHLYNPWVDGEFKDVCKNSQVNCNIYGIKPDVWLNGGPAANGLGPDGEYFFAVLVPGGQPNPNDGGVCKEPF